MNQCVTKEDLARVCNVFRIEGEMVDFEVINMGNINQTYRVNYVRSTGKKKSYILQKINTYVFKNPRQIMHNIDLVTEYIYHSGESKKCLHFHHTSDRKNYYFEGGESFWRLCNYIDSLAFDTSDDLVVMYGAGSAFGKFQTILSSFDAGQLYETIPDFHNTKKRLQTFKAHIQEDAFDRVNSVKNEIESILSMEEVACRLTDLLDAGKIPLRVTHNDTKINNVLFERESRAPLCVIDLDTVMPGLVMHDFGDAVRAACSTAAEDEKDLELVSLDLNKYRAFTRGFISQTASALTQPELDTMALGAVTLALELAIRFLDDYITGDKYFKIKYEKHNLDRARCQLKLAQDMYAKFDDMNRIVREVAGENA